MLGHGANIYREAGDDTNINVSYSTLYEAYANQYESIELKDQNYAATGGTHLTTGTLIVHEGASLTTHISGRILVSGSGENIVQIGGFRYSSDTAVTSVAAGSSFAFSFSQATVTALRDYAEFSAGDLKLGGYAMNGSKAQAENARLINNSKLFFCRGGYADQIVNVNNVALDLSTYSQTNTMGGLDISGGNYTLDVTGAITQMATITGELTLILDDAMFQNIANNAETFSVKVSLADIYGKHDSVSTNDELRFIIQSTTGVQLGGNFSSSHVDDKTGYYNWDTVIVPEPSTATLSLLTLAGLAARRRRV